MGSYHSYYFCPAVRIKTPKELHKSEIKLCSCKEHSKNIDAKFCSECGEELQLVQEEKEFEVDLDDKLNLEFLKIVYTEGDYTFFVAGELTPNYNVPIILHQNHIEIYTEDFKKTYKRDIESISNYIGEEAEIVFMYLNSLR